MKITSCSLVRRILRRWDHTLITVVARTITKTGGVFFPNAKSSIVFRVRHYLGLSTDSAVARLSVIVMAILKNYKTCVDSALNVRRSA